ncbi:MAG: ArsR/SmtB family transcription factor [Candidatus Heimdallarchaeaceae archaeon]
MTWEDEDIMEDVEALMELLSNSTRRKILQLLAEESLYPFQIARLLNISPRLIGKYIKELEEAQLVTTTKRESDKGPSRTYARLNKAFSLIIDISPNNFSWKIVPIEEENEVTEKTKISITHELSKEIPKIKELIRNKIAEIERLDNTRKELVHEINEAFSRFKGIIESEICDYTDRVILRELFKVITKRKEDWISLTEFAAIMRMWSGELFERLQNIAKKCSIIKIKQKDGQIWFSI